MRPLSGLFAVAINVPPGRGHPQEGHHASQTWLRNTIYAACSQCTRVFSGNSGCVSWMLRHKLNARCSSKCFRGHPRQREGERQRFAEQSMASKGCSATLNYSQLAVHRGGIITVHPGATSKNTIFLRDLGWPLPRVQTEKPQLMGEGDLPGTICKE